MARFALALVVLPVAALAAAGCGGNMLSANRAASPLSAGCTARGSAASSGILLWRGAGRIYFVDRQKVISSQGRGVSLPASATPVGFSGCSTPLVLYTVGSELHARPLTGGGKTLSLGRDAFVAPDGGLVSVSGTRIRYAGGSFDVHGLPLNWKITSLVASPRDPRVFLAAAQSPEAGIELCGKGLGGIYRVSPHGARTILVDNPCHDHPQAAWSPDGATISYVGGPAKDLYTLDSSGAHPRRVTSDGPLVRYVWSPDGTRIAYATKHGTAAVVAVGSREVRMLGRGSPLAWSPSGREIAFAAAGRPQIEAVPASGGSGRVLLRLPKS